MDATTKEDPWPLPELTRARRAIVVVDVVESVRLMQEDEAGFIERWRRFVHQVRTQVLPEHGGRLVKSLGDGMLLEAADARQGIALSLAIQRRELHGEATVPHASRIRLRIGAHVGEFVSDDVDIYGASVNLTARLAALASPGEVIISAEMRDLLTDGFDASIEDLGERYVKHLEQPIRAFRAGSATDADPIIVDRPRRASLGRLKPALAVLPLSPLLPQAASLGDQNALGQAVADELTIAFGASDHLHVISRLSSSAFARRTVRVRDIGRRLGADYVLSGTVRHSGGQVHLGLELAAAKDESVVWSTHSSSELNALFDGSSKTMHDVMCDVSRAIVQNEVARVGRYAAPSLESYSLLIGATTLMHRQSLRVFERSRTLLEALIERHPRLAAPYAWLGKWHVLRVAQGWSSDAVAEGRLAASTVARALDQEPDNALSLAIDGLVSAYVLRDLGLARRRYDDALQAGPNESLAWLFNSALLSYEQQGIKAAECADYAIRLSPLDPMRYYYLTFAATAHLSAGHFERAIELARASIRANRAHSPAYRNLAIAQVLSGDGAAARATVAQLLELEPKLTVRGFVARYPGAGTQQARRFADALRDAGLPD